MRPQGEQKIQKYKNRKMEKLSEKIAAAVDLLKKGENTALAMSKEGYWVGFSGGKDSQAVYHLCKLAGVKFQGYYCVTGIDSPETIHFIKKQYPEIVFLHPKENFFELVQKKGMPIKQKRYCCERLKERFGAGRVVLTGVRAQESVKRSKYGAIEVFSTRKEHEGKERKRNEGWLQQTQHECIKGQDRIMVRPILDWTVDNVFEFLMWVGVEINPSYQKYERVGCMFCPFAKKEQIEKYEKENPLYVKRLMLAIERWGQRKGYFGLDGPEDVYKWWKSNIKLEKYLADKK